MENKVILNPNTEMVLAYVKSIDKYITFSFNDVDKVNKYKEFFDAWESFIGNKIKWEYEIKASYDSEPIKGIVDEEMEHFSEPMDAYFAVYDYATLFLDIENPIISIGPVGGEHWIYNEDWLVDKESVIMDYINNFE